MKLKQRRVDFRLTRRFTVVGMIALLLMSCQQHGRLEVAAPLSRLPWYEKVK
jgi:hypothetical protein